MVRRKFEQIACWQRASRIVWRALNLKDDEGWR